MRKCYRKLVVYHLGISFLPLRLPAKATLDKILTFKSSHLYLGRVAPSAIGWYQKGPCVKLRLRDKKLFRF